jgi:hypothetical protein
LSSVLGVLEVVFKAGSNMGLGLDTFLIISMLSTGHTPGFLNMLWIFPLVKLIS